MADTIEGRNPVLEALKAGHPISKILMDYSLRGKGVVGEIVSLARESGIPVDYVDGFALNRLTVIGAHQGVIAQASVKEYLDLDDLVAISKEKNEPPLYLIVDGIEDPQNLGAILRTAEATGVHGVVLRSRRAVGLTPSVAKASAGAIEYIAAARVVNTSQAMETLKKSGVWSIGIDMTGTMDYTKADYRQATALVIGGEGKGLSPLVRKRCDFVVSIPMKGKITSLNASVAAALVMYEAFRQRRQ